MGIDAQIVTSYELKALAAAARNAGGQLAVESTEIPGRRSAAAGHGTFAIYVQGGVDHGLWEQKLGGSPAYHDNHDRFHSGMAPRD